MSKRDPELTRRKLLEAAFAEIQRRGFTGASLDAILKSAKVTKGALYHHFSSKSALGYAVVDELVGQTIRNQWVRPLQDADDPITGLQETLRLEIAEKPLEQLDLEAPAIRLAQEMSGQDEGLRKRLDNVMTAWRGGIAATLSRGQRDGTVRDDVDVHRVSAFIVAAIAGILATAKSARSVDQLRSNTEILSSYLQGLRATPDRFSTATSQALQTR